MKRYLEDNTISNLKNSALWQQKICPDCEQQETFFTIRENRADIYHKGGLLFCFQGNTFKTHIKYAAAIDSNDDNEKNYLSENQFKNMHLAPNYLTGYQRIKENCSKYSGIEAIGVSQIYHKYSCLSQRDIVVLDIEISFVSLEKGNKKDRIDLLLLHRNTGELQFVEAKHFSNKELWSTTEPAVIKQIKRYEKQIQDKEEQILAEYGKYVDHINEIFDTSLPTPRTVNKQVSLLIFGFDNDQKQGRLNRLINKSSYYQGIKSYQIGEIKKATITQLWKATPIK